MTTVQSYRQAVAWYRKVANQGHDKAQYSLGMMYNFGYGVIKSTMKAKVWIKKSSANNDHTISQYAQNFGTNT